MDEDVEALGGADAKGFAERARRQFAASYAEVEAARDRLVASEGATAKDMPAAVSQMNKVLTILLEAERRADELAERERGGVGAGAWDFEAIRREIGERLDRLRAAAGSGRLP